MTHVFGHTRLGLMALVTLCCVLLPLGAGLAQDATPVAQPPTEAPTAVVTPSEEPQPALEPSPTGEPSPGLAEEALAATPSDATAARSQSIEALAATQVSPENPTIVQAVCKGGGIIPPTVTPPATAGLTYQVEGTPAAGGATVVVAFLANTDLAFGPMPDGWVVEQNVVAVATFILDPIPTCPNVVPVSPTVTSASCVEGTFFPPSVVLPADTPVLGYALAGQVAVGNPVSVTASLVRDTDTWAMPLPDGWVLQGSVAEFSIATFAKAACTPNDPGTCMGRWTVPANTNAITFAFVGGGGNLIVGATLQLTSVVWADPMPPTSRWQAMSPTYAIYPITNLLNPCPTGSLADPAVFQQMIVGNLDPGDTIDLTPTVPTSEGIAYSVSGLAGPGQTITVTANLQAGYGWPDDLPPGWSMVDADTATHTFVLSADLEIVTSPVVPLVQQASCDDEIPVVTVADTAGITYEKSGDEVAGGEIMVSATLDTGYDWAGTLPAGWNLDDDHRALYAVALDPLDCDQNPAPPASAPPASTALVSSLPSTGSGSTGAMSLPWMAIAALMCVMGGMTIRRRHDRPLD